MRKLNNRLRFRDRCRAKQAAAQAEAAAAAVSPSSSPATSMSSSMSLLTSLPAYEDNAANAANAAANAPPTTVPTAVAGTDLDFLESFGIIEVPVQIDASNAPVDYKEYPDGLPTKRKSKKKRHHHQQQPQQQQEAKAEQANTGPSDMAPPSAPDGEVPMYLATESQSSTGSSPAGSLSASYMRVINNRQYSISYLAGDSPSTSQVSASQNPFDSFVQLERDFEYVEPHYTVTIVSVPGTSAGEAMVVRDANKVEHSLTAEQVQQMRADRDELKRLFLEHGRLAEEAILVR